MPSLSQAIASSFTLSSSCLGTSLPRAEPHSQAGRYSTSCFPSVALLMTFLHSSVWRPPRCRTCLLRPRRLHASLRHCPAPVSLLLRWPLPIS
eukprot:4289230-Pleurochrysis_carterae.AAC.1